MSDAARIAELERRLRDLERRLPSGLGAGAGLSTQLGTSVARPTQVGFPAKITDAFDASLGYAWEALVKETDPTVSAVASNPLTGVHAVALDNDETLAVDTVVWLEPDPGGRGYLITNSSGGGSGSAVYAGRYETTGPLAVEKNAAGTDGATYANPVIPAGATLPDNAPVFFFEIPTDAGKYWVIPSGPASSVYPGYVTIGIQAFLGQKTFVNSATSGDALYVLGGGSGLMAGGGTGSGTYPLAVPTSEGSALSAATTATPPDSTRDYLRLVGGTGTQTSYVATSPIPSAGSGADLWLIPGAASGAAGRSVSMGRFGYYNATDTKVYTGVSGSTMVGVDVQGGIVVGGTALTDPNADRLVFWDDSAGALAYATPSGLEFSTTTFRLVNQGAVTDPVDSTGGAADGTLAAVGDTSAGDESAAINNNFADLAAAFAALTAKLRTAGIIS